MIERSHVALFLSLLSLTCVGCRQDVGSNDPGPVLLSDDLTAFADDTEVREAPPAFYAGCQVTSGPFYYSQWYDAYSLRYADATGDCQSLCYDWGRSLGYNANTIVYSDGFSEVIYEINYMSLGSGSRCALVKRR